MMMGNLHINHKLMMKLVLTDFILQPVHLTLNGTVDELLDCIFYDVTMKKTPEMDTIC